MDSCPPKTTALRVQFLRSLLRDDALGSANLMLGNGANAAWIVDRDGNLALSADQECPS